MEFLDVTHGTFLVAMSCVIALVAGFTGLSLTRDLSKKPIPQRKVSIALASVALGGGIWAMHFVAMLGLQMPILFYYDAAITLISALTAILIVGAALILLHFTERTPAKITLAGGIVGVGILVMHYIGMAGLELCRAIHTPFGVGLSSVAAIGLCIMAFWVTYGHRTNRNILLGTVCFAIAVCAVHFLAMAGTKFVAEPSFAEFGPSMSNETLALGVIFFSFLIFGACLWVSVTYLPSPSAVETVMLEPVTTAPAARLPRCSLPRATSCFCAQMGTTPRSTQPKSGCSAPGQSRRPPSACCPQVSCRRIAVIWSIRTASPSLNGPRTRAGVTSRARTCRPPRSAGQI